MTTDSVRTLLTALQWGWLLSAVVLVLVSQGKLLADTGKSGWLILVPFYGHYLLYKRTSDSSTIYLLSLAFSVLAVIFCVFFPFMGYCFFAAPVICLFFLSIVVAAAYGISTLFGIGLFFLPMIFYFALAFDKDPGEAAAAAA